MSARRHPGLSVAPGDAHTESEAEPVIFGFWVFLMSDVVLFALLFATYAAMRAQGIAGGPTPRAITDLAGAAIETALLLTSSFTFGMASLALKYRDDTRRLARWLAITGLLGIAFLGMEARDFATLIGHGAVPQRSGFLSAHFTLLGTHGLHVAAGLVWMAVMFARIAIAGVDDRVRLAIMRLALFWHMLDIVWVGIFTFVFLYGATG